MAGRNYSFLPRTNNQPEPSQVKDWLNLAETAIRKDHDSEARSGDDSAGVAWNTETVSCCAGEPVAPSPL